jgi:hypothetical protein
MPFDRRLEDAPRLAAVLVALGFPACGTGVGTGDGAGGSRDAARPGTESAPAGPADATKCADACGDAPIDATQGVDAPDASDTTDAFAADDALDASDADEAADAPEAIDWPPVTHNEVCHVIWPQPAGYSGGGNTSLPLVVDASGNTYALISYASNPPSPPLDLGVPSPGDPVGIAIVKVDPQCHLVWMREFGGPPGSTEDGGFPSINGSIAVDATSSVTLAGEFNGPVDLGAGPLDGYQVGYVLRLDASGNVVFSHTYPANFPSLIGVQPDGSAAFLFFDYAAFGSAYACWVGNDCDGGVPEAGTDYYSFVELDATGAEVARDSFPGFPGTAFGGSTFADVSLDPAGMLWAIDNYADAGPSVERLTPFGVPIWSQPTDAADLVLGPAGGVGYSFSASSNETFEAFGFDGGESWSRTVLLGTSQPAFRDVAVDSTGTIYAAGQVDPRALPPGDAQWPSSVVGVEVLDPLGRLQGIRAWTGGSNDYYGYQAVGVDPNGNAVIGGYSTDDDGGYSYFIVKLGP